MGWADTKGDWSQRKQRAEQDFFDQHGRKYYGSIELKSGAVAGLMEMLFKAPLMPKQEYLERVPRKPYDLYINYKRWKADIRARRSEWEKEGRQLARKMYGSAYDPRKQFGIEVLEVIGPPPEAIEPIIAAEQGNKWVLGRSTKVDMRLVKFFEPEQIDPNFESQEDEEDFSEVEEAADPGATGGRRVRVRSNRPEPRAVVKGSGAAKSQRKMKSSSQRERFPKGHPKAGQFVPLPA